MPKIPTYEGKVARPVSRPAQIPLGFVAGPALEVERAGLAVAEMGLKLRESYRSTLYAKHISESATELQAMALEFEQDPEIWTIEERAKKAIEEFKSKRIAEIKDPHVAKYFGFSFDKLAATRFTSIASSVRVRQADYNKAETLEALKGLEEAYAGAANEAEAVVIMGQMKAIIMGGAQAGDYGFAEAERMWQEISERVIRSSYVRDIDSGIEGARDALEDLESKETEMDEEDRLSLIKYAKQQIGLYEKAVLADEKTAKAEAKLEEEEKIKAIQLDFVSQLHAGALTPEMVLASNLPAVGLGSQSWFLKAIEDKAKAALKDEDSPWDITKGSTYAEVLTKIYGDEIQTEEEILEYAGKGIAAEKIPGLIEKWKKHRDKTEDPTNTTAYKQAMTRFTKAADEGVFESEEEEYEAMVEFERRIAQGKPGDVPYTQEEVGQIAKDMLFPYKESWWDITKRWMWGGFFPGEEEPTEELPPADQNEGVTVEDIETGERYRSDGKEWERVE